MFYNPIAYCLALIDTVLALSVAALAIAFREELTTGELMSVCAIALITLAVFCAMSFAPLRKRESR
jgi:hypothetical protein